MLFTREATNEEVKVYEMVEAITSKMSDDEFRTFLDVVSKRIYDYTGNKKIYNKAYRMVKKYGLTLKEVETWYCIDTF